MSTCRSAGPSEERGEFLRTPVCALGLLARPCLSCHFSVTSFLLPAPFLHSVSASLVSILVGGTSCRLCVSLPWSLSPALFPSLSPPLQQQVVLSLSPLVTVYTVSTCCCFSLTSGLTVSVSCSLSRSPLLSLSRDWSQNSPFPAPIFPLWGPPHDSPVGCENTRAS